MTAYRVVDDHSELANAGTVPHADLDSYVLDSGWVIVSGSAGPVPPSARLLKAGAGISIVDNGPGGTLVITAVTTPTAQMSWMEVPSGVPDGSNFTFSLAHSPVPSSALMFFVNGVLQLQGAGSDYTLAGGAVSLSVPPRSGSNILATYPY